MKKKQLFIGLAFIALGIIIAGVGLSHLQQTSSEIENIDIPFFPNIIGPSGSYVLAASFPAVNDSYPVFRTIPPSDNSTGEFRRLAGLFNITGKMETVESNGKIHLIDALKQPTAEFAFNTNTGEFAYYIPDKRYPSYPDPEADLPSDEETRVLATNYLKERGLLPDDVHFERVIVRDSFMEVTPTSVTEYNLTKHVSFVQEIEGLRVYGAGVGLTINEKSEIVSAGSSLKVFDPKPVRYVEILTPEQAYHQLRSGDLMIQPLSENYDYIRVTNISLAYWMGNYPSYKNYILPIYVFSCVAAWDGKTEEVIRYVNAVDPSEMQYVT